MMAYLKIKPIKNKTHLQRSVDYICNGDKTEKAEYVIGYKCDSKNIITYFEEIAKKSVKDKGNNIAHHLV